ncbi:MAG: hypothetical protein ACI9J3_000929, partial [Parvicellaceae bacterium]
MRHILIALSIILILASCSSEAGMSYQTKFWIGSYDALSEGEVADMQKEIQGKLDVLILIADDSFSNCEKFNIVNEESTSTFELVITDNDTSKVELALSSY